MSIHISIGLFQFSLWRWDNDQNSWSHFLLLPFIVSYPIWPPFSDSHWQDLFAVDANYLRYVCTSIYEGLNTHDTRTVCIVYLCRCILWRCKSSKGSWIVVSTLIMNNFPTSMPFTWVHDQFSLKFYGPQNWLKYCNERRWQKENCMYRIQVGRWSEISWWGMQQTCRGAWGNCTRVRPLIQHFPLPLRYFHFEKLLPWLKYPC